MPKGEILFSVGFFFSRFVLGDEILLLLLLVPSEFGVDSWTGGEKRRD